MGLPVLHLSLAQVVMAVFGSLNLLLESPFLASLFWMNLGLTLRTTRLLAAEPALSMEAAP